MHFPTHYATPSHSLNRRRLASQQSASLTSRLRVAAIILALITSLPASASQDELSGHARRPNILFILSDDQGWRDYGFMGNHGVSTPNLDRLAADSLLFERAYVASPLCRPSLASIVTGHHPSEHGITANDVTGGMFVINEAGDTVLLQGKRAASEAPFGDRFRHITNFVRELSRHGYTTFQTGKWWEGSFQNGGFVEGMTEGERHGDKGLAIGREGLEPIAEFLNRAGEGNAPFFLWYAPFLPHTPHNPPERLLTKYSGLGLAEDIVRYHATIEWFDETCGKVLEMLREKGLANDTVVIYLCDNGWAPASTTGDWLPEQVFREYAMRSKASPYENGIRTPLMISWPGVVKPGRRSEPAHSIDLFPTIAAIADLPVDYNLPGIDLLDPAALAQRRTVFGSMHASHNMDYESPDSTLQYLWCVEGRWKLIQRFHGDDTTEFKILHRWDTAPYRLFDLESDPMEKNDLAAAEPDIVARLSQRIAEWREGLQTPSALSSLTGH